MTKKERKKIISELSKTFDLILEGFCEMPPSERLKCIEACRERAQTETNSFMKMLYKVCGERLPELHEKIVEAEVSNAKN